MAACRTRRMAADREGKPGRKEIRKDGLPRKGWIEKEKGASYRGGWNKQDLGIES